MCGFAEVYCIQTALSLSIFSKDRKSVNETSPTLGRVSIFHSLYVKNDCVVNVIKVLILLLCSDVRGQGSAAYVFSKALQWRRPLLMRHFEPVSFY